MKTNLLLLALTGLVAGFVVSCSQEADVSELRKAGKQAFLEEDYPAARQYLLKALATAPSDKDLLYFTAQAYGRDYMLDSALFYYKRIDVLYPEDRETNQQIFSIAMELEEWEDAIGAISVLAKTGDGYEPYLGQLSDLWARTGSYINALYWARRAIAVQPDNQTEYVKASGAAAQCDSIEVAMELIETAIEKFGAQPKFRANKAAFLARMNRHKEAEQLFREIIAEDSLTPGFKLGLAHSLAAQGKKDKKREALALYRSVQGLIPPAFGVDSLIQVLSEELE